MRDVMFRKTMAALLMLLLPAAVAFADIQTDLRKALGEGTSLTDAVTSMIAATPAQAADIISAAVVLQPEAAGAVVQAAIGAGIEPGEVVLAAISADPATAAQAVTAAVSIAPKKEDEIVQAAILAGADPTTVAAATAAGRAPPSPFAPASMPNVGIGRGGVTPFGVGWVPGSVGDGPVSPS